MNKKISLSKFSIKSKLNESESNNVRLYSIQK